MKVNLYCSENARWAITLQGNFSEFSDPGMAGSKLILQNALQCLWYEIVWASRTTELRSNCQVVMLQLFSRPGSSRSSIRSITACWFGRRWRRSTVTPWWRIVGTTGWWTWVSPICPGSRPLRKRRWTSTVFNQKHECVPAQYAGLVTHNEVKSAWTTLFRPPTSVETFVVLYVKDRSGFWPKATHQSKNRLESPNSLHTLYGITELDASS